MTVKRRKYTREFKVEAVKLVTEHGCTVPEAAENLGISPNLIYNWKQKLAPESEVDVEELDQTARLEAEVKRLRKENARLTMEREILKKATAFFAKENS